MYIYAGDNKDRLPSIGQGFWAWDLPWAVGDTFYQSGTPWTSLYCPGTAPRFSEQDNFRLYYVFATNAYHVLGYVMTLTGTPTLTPTNYNPTIIPHEIPYAGILLPAPSPSERVLAADATLSLRNDEANRAGNEYVMVPGGYRDTTGTIKPHLSPHLKGSVPAGGNLVMLDG